MENVSRRAVVRGAAWSVPVIAAAIATPLAAASQPPTPPRTLCTPRNPYDGDVQAVSFAGVTMAVIFRQTARNWVDVTVRQAGFKEIHYNLGAPGQPTNNQPHMKNYTPGGVFTIVLPRPFDAALGDWFQVQTIHPNNCAVTS